MNKLERIIYDYENGNVADAKKAAKRFKMVTLGNAFSETGKGPLSSAMIARFLKGKATFQEAADAEFLEKNK
jgi:hypothetical protein